MKVLYHHRTLGDGAEGIHIAEMVTAMRSLGSEVHVRGLAGVDRHAGRESLASRVKRLLPRAAFEGASLLSNVAEYIETRRAIRDIRPDFLYKRHARLDTGALMAARDAAIPAVLEVNCLFTGVQYHQFEPMSFGRIAARLERRAIQLADVVLAVSTPLAHQIEALSGMSPVVMPNGADPDRSTALIRHAPMAGWCAPVTASHHSSSSVGLGSCASGTGSICSWTQSQRSPNCDY
jgi:hypothetical protein